jgi:hypothetical protein
MEFIEGKNVDSKPISDNSAPPGKLPKYIYFEGAE